MDGQSLNDLGKTRPASEILNFKINRSAAGSFFPFDRLYVFKEEVLDLAKRTTPNNITFEMSRSIRDLLKALSVTEYKRRTMGREIESHPLPLGRGDSSGFHSLNVERRGPGLYSVGEAQSQNGLLQDLIKHLETKSDQKWFVMIPILGISGRNGTKPAYLVNRRWSNSWSKSRSYQNRRYAAAQGASSVRTIPDTASLKVLDQETSPPCLKCERLMAHMAGECEIGGDICLKTMVFSERSYFQDSLDASNDLSEKSVEDIMEMIAKRNLDLEETNGVQEDNS